MIQEQRVCGRPLIDFLNGKPLETKESKVIRVKTGNDILMLSAKCLLVHGDYKLCWEHEPVAKPFEFIDNRCKVIEMDDGELKVHCLGPRSS